MQALRKFSLQIAAVSLILLTVVSVSAQYSLESFAIHTAGGQLAAEPYTMWGDLGQIEGEALSIGGGYSVRGGFVHGFDPANAVVADWSLF